MAKKPVVPKPKISAPKKMEKETDLLEICPKCGSDEFAIDKGIGSKRYCQKCNHVWLPMSAAEIENMHLNKIILQLKSENAFLKDHISDLESNDEEMFS